jgi:transcription antitermination factor NusA-like protein
MAIGKKGQNIRLATQLTAYELDMYNYAELPAFKAKLAELRGEPIPEGAILEEGVTAEAAPAEEAPVAEAAPESEAKAA